MSQEKFQTLLQCIKERQSIFPGSFTGEKVDNAIIAEILSAADNAPSHKHTEPWRLHVITPAALPSFKAYFQDLYTRVDASGGYKEIKHKKIGKKIESSSHIIIIGMKRDQQESVPEWEEIASVASVIQNLSLCLKPLGLGGYWSSPGYFIEHVHEYVNFEEGERCLGLYYLGVTKEDLPEQIIKKPIEQKIKWITK